MASNSLLTVEPLCLHVLVMSASGLFKKDLFGLCDPYVKVTMKRKNKSMITEQTKKRKKTLNPEWGEKFVFKDIKLVDDSLLFEVFDENKLTRDNFLGKLHFKLSHIPIEMKKIDIMQYERSATYPLKPRSHKSRVSGSLKLKFLYYNKPPSRMGTATLMGELNLASLVEGSTGRSSPQAPGGGGAPHENAHAGGVALSPTSLSRQESTASEWMVDEDEPMPEGWQERQDANGRTFYVDHINRRTQWNRPTSSANVGANQRRAQMLADRQRMMAQTLARRNPGMTGSESQLDLTSLNGSPAGSRSSLALTTASMGMGTNSPVSPRYSVAMSTPTTNTAARSTSPNPPSVRNSIAVTTPATNADSSVPPALPPRATSVSSASIPRLPPPPSRSSANTPSAPARNNAISFQQPTSSLSRTSMATSPTPSSQQSNGDNLPEGWEMRTASNGRPFYIDHSSRKTQWHKPTAPAPSRQRPQQQQQQQPTTNPTSNGPATTPTSHTSTSASSSSTTSSSSSSAPPSDEELGPLPSGWEMRLLADGRKFFIEHATRSTQWEDPRLQAKKQQKQQQQQVSTPGTPFSRDYKLKYEQLRRHIKANHPADLPRVFEIPVRRQHLFEDSHRAIMNCKNRSHLKARLWVKFDGEKGLDYGGVSREWFFLLSHEMFNPYYGLFEYAASDNYTLQVNPESGFCNENHLEYFRFIGRILAMAIYHQRLIDAFFVRPFYKMLTSKRIVLSDMEMVDTEFYNSIKYILENDPEPLCLTFTANREFVGQVEEVELKPGGTDIDVTESNKKEYIELLMKWRFENRITKQMEALKKGFSDVVNIKQLAPFDAQEIEYLMCGIGEINIEDWRKHTVYAAGYKAGDDVIIWFWKAVTNFDNELRARLLQFVTGTSKVPMNGFGELQGSNGPQKFCIKKLGDPTSLPRSHTCFNRIDLPPYRSYHELKEKLRVAIENTEGFEGVD